MKVLYRKFTEECICKLCIIILAVIIMIYGIGSAIINGRSENISESGGDTEIAVEKTDSTVSDTTPDLTALAAALIDGNTGRILYEKNGYERKPMASTTKIMTCIIALENGNLDDVVTVSDYAVSMPKVHLGMKSGQQFYLRDLLYSLMLESHNDTAVAIAEHISGSVEEFAEFMNERAKQLGAYDTHFVTPNGLDDEEHYTTATDLGLIGAYAVKNDEFIDIINTSSYSFSTVDGQYSYSVSNKNSFLTMMDGAIGIKTGFTNGAGYCFVGAVKTEATTFVSVVLGSGWPPNKTYKWSDTRKLMNYGIENFKLTNVFEGISELKQIEVEDGIEDVTGTYVEGNLSIIKSEEESIEYEMEIPEQISAPVHKGDIVGVYKVLVNGTQVGAFPIKASDEIEKITIKYCFDKLMSYFLLPI